MADEKEQPLLGEQLTAQLRTSRQQTLDAVSRPTESPVFRVQDDGSVRLRGGQVVEARK